MSSGGASLVGRTLGDFQIQERLGAGAMGEVYRAHWTTRNRPAAVKTISNEGPARAKAADRFKREAEILFQFKHPNIVRFYYAGRDKETRLMYMAMELIDGSTLEEEIERRRVAKSMEALDREGIFHWTEVANLAVQLCDALHYAHERGIVHRDLKPSNLMMTKSGELKLTDFGIAKDLDASALTATGRTLGTAAYMAPEQITGGEVSHKTDLYALGIVLYQLFTGEPAFTASTQVALMHRHMTDTPPNVSTTVEEIPVEFEELMIQLMAKKPADRPWDAAQVGEVLKKLLKRHEANQPIKMVHDAVNSVVNLRAISPKVKTKATKGKGKGKSRSGEESDEESWLERHREKLVTAGLGLAALGILALILFILRGPSDAKLLERADYFVAQENWDRAIEVLDSIKNKAAVDADKFQSLRDAALLKITERQARILDGGGLLRVKPKNRAEELYREAADLASEAAKRKDEQEAHRVWQGLAASLQTLGEEYRGWELLARTRADELGSTLDRRSTELRSRLQRVGDEIAQGRIPAALDLFKVTRREFATFSDARSILEAEEKRLRATLDPEHLKFLDPAAESP